MQIITFDLALGILRLSHKYQIDGLQKAIKLKLLEHWPLEHSEYLARLASLETPEHRIPQAAKLIEAAQRCQANELLPTAFYELSCVRGTGCLEVSRNISPENVARLWIGHACVERRLRSFVDSNPNTPTRMWARANIGEASTIFEYREAFPCCTHSERFVFDFPSKAVCPSTFPTFGAKLAERLFNGTTVLTALQQLSREPLSKNVCLGCRDWFKSVLENKIQELWECIPADFDLPPVDPVLYSKIQIHAF